MTKPAHTHRTVVTPVLRRLLGAVFLLFALLAVNSFYLGAVTLADYLTGEVYQDYFYLLMFLLHLVLGLLLVTPFLLFAIRHLRRAVGRPNRYAVRAGLALFVCGLLLLLSGILLTRFGLFDINHAGARSWLYWLHVMTPFAAAWLFVLHRLAGARIRWRPALAWGGLALAFAGAMLSARLTLTSPIPRAEATPFFPALSRIQGGQRIPAAHLSIDDTCAECHADIAHQAEQSMHRLSSFNNPAYRVTVEETRAMALARDGDLAASQLCAACHDPVPLFDGRFGETTFDPDRDASAHRGVTCAVCHAITRVNSPRGNGDFTIVDPPRYPFAFSDQPLLKALNHQLVKAKPALHKKTWLKPLHRSAEFCSVCHKVHLPFELNRYKWLRGQNHYDSFLLSGVSGHRVDSFYYPPRAIDRCAECHMPLTRSEDPAARDFDGSGQRSVHGHGFAAANTGVPHMLGLGEPALASRAAVLQGAARVDLFGLKTPDRIDGALTAPLGERLPTLEAGTDYLLEVVIRNLRLGHHLTQGTADSNELWLQLTVRDGERVIARSGQLGRDGEVDPWAYFVNSYLLDREGQRVERRNAHDVVVALYDHQIPPGAASVVHYRLRVPEDARGPLHIDVQLRYRKFTTAFLRHVYGEQFAGNDLPIVTMAHDSISLPLRGGGAAARRDGAPPAAWERWNDYGIGLLREGGSGMGKGELRQAQSAFRQVERLGRAEGAVNLARIYLREGRLARAAAALARAAAHPSAGQPWTIAWLSAQIHRQRGDLDQAIDLLRGIVDGRFGAARRRGFDFSYDIRVQNELGRSLYERARQERGSAARARRIRFLTMAQERFERVLSIDPENVSAHFNLARLYQELGDESASRRHSALHARYKPDDQAVERVVTAHRSANPAADHAAAAIVIHDLVATPERPAVADGGAADADGV